MVENARRSRVEGERRGTPVPQWEVFVREDESDPLRHVGSVAAVEASEAADHASRLFGWYAADLWVCPADAVERYSTRALSGSETENESEFETDVEVETTAGADTNAGTDAETNAGTEVEPESDARESEPRVYEELEGTPRVDDS